MAMVQVILQLRLIERENQNESIIFRMLFWNKWRYVVASLLDLGASKEVLEEVLSSLPLTGFKTEITRVK